MTRHSNGGSNISRRNSVSQSSLHGNYRNSRGSEHILSWRESVNSNVSLDSSGRNGSRRHAASAAYRQARPSEGLYRIRRLIAISPAQLVNNHTPTALLLLRRPVLSSGQSQPQRANLQHRASASITPPRTTRCVSMPRAGAINSGMFHLGNLSPLPAGMEILISWRAR